MILTALLAAFPAIAEEISVSDVPALSLVDVLFLGETHDNPWQHENQTLIVAAWKPKAVVYEMLTAEKAAIVTPELLGDVAAMEAALDWAHSGWPDFAMYYPVFVAGGNARVYGAQVTREAVRSAIMDGNAAGAFGEGADTFGLTSPLGEQEQADREAEQFEAHCNALPEVMLPGMVLGQRLRDAALAREIMRALDETGGPVAVITGNGHARIDWGAPRLLPEAVLQRSIGQVEGPPEGVPPHDFWIVTPEAEREDPCLVFKKG